MISLNTSLPYLAFKTASAEEFNALVKSFAESTGRVKYLEDTPGEYNVIVNDVPLEDTFTVTDGAPLLVLAFRADNDTPSEDVTIVKAKANNFIEVKEVVNVKKTLGGAPKQAAAPLAAVGEGSTLYFTNTNASGAGSLWAVMNSASNGDVILPSPSLFNGTRFITISFPHSFPLGSAAPARVSLKSGKPGYKVILDFNNVDVSSTVNGSISASFEDIVFLNYAGSGGSYAQVQITNAASGYASFNRCAFVNWNNDALVMFRHSSTSNTAKIDFYSCLFIKSAASTVVNGWAVSGYVTRSLVSCSFYNSGTTGYPVINTAQISTLNYCVADIASAAAARVTYSTNGTAITGTAEDIKTGEEGSLDYFGYTQDKTLGAVSGGIYSDYLAFSENKPPSSFVGIYNGVANCESVNHCFTFARLDRNYKGDELIDTRRALFYSAASPEKKLGKFYKANATSVNVVSNTTQDNFTLHFIPAYTSHFDINGAYYFGASAESATNKAVTVKAVITSGLDIKEYCGAPNLFYIGSSSSISSLVVSDWAFNSVTGSSPSEITQLNKASCFKFNFNSDVTINYPADSVNAADNTYIQYDGAKVTVMVGSEDVTEQLKAAGKIVDYVAQDYITYIFGEDNAALATLALDTPVLEAQARVKFFGVKEHD